VFSIRRRSSAQAANAETKTYFSAAVVENLNFVLKPLSHKHSDRRAEGRPGASVYSYSSSSFGRMGGVDGNSYNHTVTERVGPGGVCASLCFGCSFHPGVYAMALQCPRP